MIDLPLPQGAALTAAREIFAELESAEALLRPQTAPRRLSASALYAAALAGDEDASLSQELDRNRDARRFYRDAVTRRAHFTFGELRAASSGTAAERHGEGCRITIQQSRAEPDQYYVVVQLLRDSVAGGTPSSLIVCDSDDRCRRFPLPALRNGVAQFIAEADSDLMRLMGDPSTRVYLG